MRDLLIGLIHYAFLFVQAIIFVHVILSWVICVQRPRWIYHPVIQWVENTAFQILRPFRQLMSSLGLGRMPIDFTPILALFAFQFIASILSGIIERLFPLLRRLECVCRP